MSDEVAIDEREIFVSRLYIALHCRQQVGLGFDIFSEVEMVGEVLPLRSLHLSCRRTSVRN